MIFKGIIALSTATVHRKDFNFMKVVNVSDQVQFKSEKMNKVSLFDTDRFFCDVYCLESGQVQKVHAHEGSDKIYYLLEGKGKITVGSEEGTDGGGDDYGSFR